MQSSKRRRETAVYWDGRGGAAGEQRVCSWVLAVTEIVFIVTCDVSTYHYVASGSHIYADYHLAHKELLWKALVAEGVKIPLSSLFVRDWYAQH